MERAARSKCVTKLHGSLLMSADCTAIKAMVRVSDVYYPEPKAELQGHKGNIWILDAHENFILSGDYSGEIIIWSFEAVLEGKPAEIVRFRSSSWNHAVPRVRLARDFIVWLDKRGSRIKVVDFA